tara:strand:- start:13 stop:1347 length:1335 start_codon:yes stop_codon:yes gene_type:complete
MAIDDRVDYSQSVKFRRNIPAKGFKAYGHVVDYRNYAYSGVKKEINMKVFKDFHFAKEMLYGKINNYDVPVIVSDIRKQRGRGFEGLLGQGDAFRSHSCIEFVADAFNDMLKEYKKALISNKLIQGENFDALKPKTSYVDPKALHSSLIKKKYKVFLRYLKTEKKDDKIFNIKTFLKYLYEYLEDSAHGVPVTLTGFVKSNLCPMNVSGLVIDLASTSHMHDKKKVKEYIESPNFCFFASVALNYGFSIDYNAPWRLVADLNSPAMQKYMSNRHISNHITTFGYYYEPAHYSGYEEFKNSAFKMYNSYVRKRSLITLTYRCKTGRLKQKLIKRSRITRAEFDNLFDDQYWIEKYIKIRNIEEVNYLSDSMQNQLILDAKSLIRSGVKSIEYILDMVEHRIIDFENKTGSLSYRLNRLQSGTDSGTISKGTGARAAFSVAGGAGY